MTHAPPSKISSVERVAVGVVFRMEQLMNMHVSRIDIIDPIFMLIVGYKNQILGVDDRNNWNDLMTNFCGVITVSVA